MAPHRFRLWSALLVAVVAAVAFAGCLNDFDETRLNRVWIEGIDVSAPQVMSGSVTLLVNVTLENRDDKSGDLALTVKAHNTATGLLVETQEAHVGTLKRDRTEHVAVPLTLPKEDGYRISVLLFQDEVEVHTAGVQVTKVTALAKTVAQSDLRVTGLEFLVANVTDGKVRIDAQVYLTNEGAGTSAPLRLQVKAREVSTGLLAAEEWADVGTITVEATKIQEVALEVPDAYNYIVEAVLWDGDFIVGQGEGKVQLLPTFTVPKDEEVVVNKPEVSDFIRDDSGGSAGDEGSEEGTPGPGVVLAIAALAAVLMFMRRRK